MPMFNALRVLLILLVIHSAIPTVSLAVCTDSMMTIEGTRYRAIFGDLAKDVLVVNWLDSKGVPFESIENVRKSSPSFCAGMNGGIFGVDFKPLGLFIHYCNEVSPLNLRNGEGNFYWKPNGVVYCTDKTLSIAVAEKFKPSPNIREAVQSGPMLLIDAAVPESIQQSTKSLNIRNGIGVIDSTHFILLLAVDKVSMAGFAQAFTALGCKDALYLDGAISGMISKSAKSDGQYVTILSVHDK